MCAASGFFDLYLNGQKISDGVMNPALSEYRKVAYYETFDITSRLASGHKRARRRPR